MVPPSPPAPEAGNLSAMDIVLAIFASTLLFVLAIVIAVMLVLRSLRRRNRVSPDRPSEAPTSWMWSPAMAARLHRRLQAAVAVARMVARRHAREPGRPPVVDLAADLEREAVALDAHLAVVGRLHPSERRRVLPRVMADVARVEQLTSRLSLLDARVSASARLPHHPGAMEELALQLETLEAAHRELGATDAAVGLHPPGGLVAQPAPWSAPAGGQRPRP